MSFPLLWPPWRHSLFAAAVRVHSHRQSSMRLSYLRLLEWHSSLRCEKPAAPTQDTLEPLSKLRRPYRHQLLQDRSRGASYFGGRVSLGETVRMQHRGRHVVPFLPLPPANNDACQGHVLLPRPPPHAWANTEPLDHLGKRWIQNHIRNENGVRSPLSSRSNDYQYSLSSVRWMTSFLAHE